MRALAGAIDAEAPDLILLQELWQPEHAEWLTRALRERGYGYAQHWARSAHGETGLFAAAKWPLVPLAFQSFSAGRLPHSFWHLDWLVSKGAASFWLETPLGRVLVENTHLQAQYVTDRYEGERLSQACELVLANRAHANTALILGGDFNSGAAESPRRALAALGGMLDAQPTSREDTVYARSGGEIALRVLDARALLGEARKLDDGAEMPLSDHFAVRVDFAVSRCTGCVVAARRNVVAERAALAELDRAAGTTNGRVAFTLVVAFACLGLAAFWRQRQARAEWRTRLGLWGFRAGLALLGFGFVWSFYLGTVYYPTRGRTLRGIARALGSAASEPGPMPAASRDF